MERKRVETETRDSRAAMRVQQGSTEVRRFTIKYHDNAMVWCMLTGLMNINETGTPEARIHAS